MTVKETEQFIKIMNPILSINCREDDASKQGNIHKFLSDFNYWIEDGNNPDLRQWLDPDYLFIDWSLYQGVVPLFIEFPAHPNIVIQEIPEFRHGFRVASRDSAHVLLGMMVNAYPRLRGVSVSSGVALSFW
jgi:hypothetical protein